MWICISKDYGTHRTVRNGDLVYQGYTCLSFDCSSHHGYVGSPQIQLAALGTFLKKTLTLSHQFDV